MNFKHISSQLFDQKIPVLSLKRDDVINVLIDTYRLLVDHESNERELEYKLKIIHQHLSYLLLLSSENKMDEENIRSLSYTFIQSLPKIKALLTTDIKKAYDQDPSAKSYEEILSIYPGIYAILIHRISHEIYTLGFPIIARIMSEYAHSKTGIDIHPGAQIDESFFIDHGTGVVIGETTIIGKNVAIYHGVTLGILSFDLDGEGNILRDTKRHPTIEDGVTIYSHAMILGGETIIGKGSVIGSNVTVTKSVEPYSKVIKKEKKDE